MSYHHYYPQLRWKPAEFESLSELDSTSLSGLTPIFTMLDIDWDYQNDKYSKTLSNYLSKFGENLATHWTENRPILLDLKYLDVHGTSRNHPLDICVNLANAKGKEIIPVVSPLSSANYILAVMRNSTNGVAISINTNSVHLIGNLINSLNLPPDSIDIIVDYENIQSVNTSLVADAISLTNQISGLMPWRTLILSSTSYPSSQAGIPQNVVHQIPRYEYELWKQVIHDPSMLRTPCFSDYPTANATITSVDPRFMSQYVAVRYSNDTSWVFVKGTSAKGNGWSQTQSLCNTLVNSGVYKVYGPNFSWGDQYIFDRAAGTNKSGNSKEWRKVAHTHHLTLVPQQLKFLAKSFSP